jgi:hypothetical protein
MAALKAITLGADLLTARTYRIDDVTPRGRKRNP